MVNGKRLIGCSSIPFFVFLTTTKSFKKSNSLAFRLACAGRAAQGEASAASVDKTFKLIR
jgi:hypothetical protein